MNKEKKEQSANLCEAGRGKEEKEMKEVGDSGAGEASAWDIPDCPRK